MAKLVCNLNTNTVIQEELSTRDLQDIEDRNPLQYRKELVIKRIKLITKERIENGLVSSSLGEPYVYPASLSDQINLHASYTVAKIRLRDGKVQCIDANGKKLRRYHTSRQISEVAEAMIDYVANLLDRCDDYVQWCEQAATKEELDSLLEAFNNG